jgi:predicted S18 family serine protease
LKNFLIGGSVKRNGNPHGCCVSMMFAGTRAVVIAPIALLAILLSAHLGAQQSRFISIPILSVIIMGDKQYGATTMLAMQIDRLPQANGPDVQFNEGSRALGVFKGSALGPDWKDSARTATVAAATALGEDPRAWRVILKEVSNSYLADGPSAGAAMAVGMVAAARGVNLLSRTALTGRIDATGRIMGVGGLPEKLQAAAGNGISTVIIPAGQTRTIEWDLRPVAESLGITLIEVPSLKEAYESMTGQPF